MAPGDILTISERSGMNVYNTRSRAIEGWEPSDRRVSLYVCGITPYDTTHLGHAFTYTVADVLVRYLESQGLRVRYVQNVTDIDDDILRKAREVGEDWRTLGNRWTAHFIRDMQALNVRPPDEYPRATDVVPEIVTAVRALMARGLAYESGGSVYFHVDAWPEFGQLSHLARAEMLPVANERGNRPDDPNKRDPLDFVLWQAQAPGEPAWESPWGPGRPGWHIECSVMSTHFLGKAIDLHGGGEDLVFPHHECEIAQAEPVTGHKPFVRVWLHTAMVEHEGAKMSKSLGNLVMVSDLLRRWPADTLRLYLGKHHYRQAVGPQRRRAGRGRSARQEAADGGHRARRRRRCAGRRQRAGGVHGSHGRRSGHVGGPGPARGPRRQHPGRCSGRSTARAGPSGPAPARPGLRVTPRRGRGRGARHRGLERAPAALRPRGLIGRLALRPGFVRAGSSSGCTGSGCTVSASTCAGHYLPGNDPSRRPSEDGGTEQRVRAAILGSGRDAAMLKVAYAGALLEFRGARARASPVPCDIALADEKDVGSLMPGVDVLVTLVFRQVLDARPPSARTDLRARAGVRPGACSVKIG